MSRALSVHPDYIQKVRLAWHRKIEGREQHLTEELGPSLPIINLFLQGQPVQGQNFLTICKVLGLNWREVAGLDVQESQISHLSHGVNYDDIANSDPVEMLGSADEALYDLLGTLCEMLRRLTRRAADLLNADRASIFLLDREREALASIIAEDGDGGSLVIEVPLDRGIASLAATTAEVINIPYDVYDDPRSEEAKNTDKKTAYRTYTILAWPLVNEKKDLVAVVQLINKLKPNYDPKEDLYRRIDTNGFTSEDEALFAKFAPSILRIVEKCQFCYQLAQRLKENKVLVRDGVVLQKADLIAELKRKARQMRRSLATM